MDSQVAAFSTWWAESEVNPSADIPADSVRRGFILFFYEMRLFPPEINVEMYSTKIRLSDQSSH